MTLQPTQFAEFFAAAHGMGEPFAWQTDLLHRVLDDGWPEVIDVPTGLGKTAVVDVAVFALALQADLPAGERTAPTRTFVIVDRRLIVDQTHAHARWLADALDRSDDAVLAEIARRLRTLAVGTVDPRPLAVVRMRGGMTWDARWLDSPAQPAIVTGTVDQLGSRLLFRGYGVSEHARPIDAALVGADRLIILDEAHLAWPLVQTLHRVDRHEQAAEQAILPRRRPAPVLLSATPPLGQDAPTSVYRPDLTREAGEEAQRRLAAVRQVRLVDLATKAKDDQEESLADALAALADAMRAEQELPSLAVVVNTVSLARRTFDRLRERWADDDVDVALLIGRARQVDKDRVVAQQLARLTATGEQTGDRPVVLVATQTVEVGADIDVAALITEAAPLDALLQRLGRLDRRGRRGASTAVVVHSAHRHTDQFLYGAATARTWEWLVEQADPLAPPVPSKVRTVATALEPAPRLDLGPLALAALLTPGEQASLAAEPPPAPVLLGPVIDAWARTSPTPDPDQNVGPFLHGIQRSRPEVAVCWRAGLRPPSTPEGLEQWRAEVHTAPPLPHETVAIPVHEARRFLRGHDMPGGADVEGLGWDDDEDDWMREEQPVDALIVGPDGELRRPDLQQLRRGGGLRPGETVLLPSTAGGYDGWGWTGVTGTGAVVGDVADLDIGRRVRLRLRDGIIASVLPDAEDVPHLPTEVEPSDVGEVLNRLGDALDRLRSADADSTTQDHTAGRLRAVVTALASGRPRIRPVPPVKEGRRRSASLTVRPAWTILERPRAASFGMADTGDGLEDDLRAPLLSSGASGPVDLDVHLRDVERRAGDVKASLGLDDRLRATLALAGLAHDLGKADDRFQVMLYGGVPEVREATGRVLAKSGMARDDRQAFRVALRRSGLPSGFRHEALSARLLAYLFERLPELGEGMDRELLLHLVASHHGRGRPLPAAILDPSPQGTLVALPGSDVVASADTDGIGADWEAPARFRRLGRRYGWWGLALLETVLRLADMAVSREYELAVDHDAGEGS